MASVEPEEKSAPQSDQALMSYGHRSGDSGDKSWFRQRLAEEKLSQQNGWRGKSKPRWKTFLTWHFGEQWVYLILLGIIPSIFSWGMDFGIDFGLDTTRWLYMKANHNVFLQYLAWVSIPVLLIIISTVFTFLVGPQAAGPGIPELKTMVKGMKVHDHVGFKTLVAKVIGLSCALGSGMPLGKESPLVHIGAACAAQLNRMMEFVGGFKQSESQRIELMIVGVAVGISSCFGSPIGGILYSIEVAASFIMVKCYWKGYFAAAVSAFAFRILPVWSGQEETITPLYKTFFRLEFPYEFSELLSFTILGVLSGLAGALFVFLNGVVARFLKSPHRISKFFVKSRVVYPAIVTLVIASVTFPAGLGQFMAGQLTQKQTLIALFDNQTWHKHLEDEHFDHNDYSVAWKNPRLNVFGTLAIFFLAKLIMASVAISMPVPCGSFVPAFVIGAGLGRLVGEVTAFVLPEGVHSNGTLYSVIPGSYAVAGAAAVSGAATHTISTAMIVFELCGQINYIFPMLLSVIVANIVAQSLQPSLYDNLINIWKLSYPIEPSWDHPENSDIQVEDIMVREVRYISLNSTYRDLQNILLTGLKSLPLVKSAESMKLLGSVKNTQLKKLLSKQLSRSRRLEYIQHRGQNTDGGNKSSSEGPAGITYAPSKSMERSTRRVSENSEVTIRSLICTHTHVAMTEEDPDVEDTMTATEIIEWEKQQLIEKINLNLCKIDPAPVQILAHTSLPMVHKIFTMMGLDLAYVTSVGTLIGVVSRQEIHNGMQNFVKERGVQIHRPMECLRESMTRLRKTATPEATELCKLLGSQTSLNQIPEEDVINGREDKQDR